MPSRALLGVVLAVALAGCFGGGPATAAENPGADAQAGSTTVSPTTVERTPTTTRAPSLGDGPHEGRGEPATANETGTPEDVRYFPANDTIRYVAGWRHTNHEAVKRGEPPEREPVYEYTPFEDWADTHAASVGAEAAGEAAARRLSIADPGVSAGVSFERETLTITLARTTLKGRDGEVISSSNVSSRQLVEVAPASVAVTVAVEDRRYDRTFPVRVENRTLVQD